MGILQEQSKQTVVRAELEAAREAFHALLRAIPDEVWRHKAANSAWTVKEELWHITWGAQFMLQLIRNGRRGLGLPKPPALLADRLNALYSKIRSAFATRESIGRRYDRTHAAVLRELSTMHDDEWDKAVRVFGEQQTIDYLFRGLPHHLEEHAARIRPAFHK